MDNLDVIKQILMSEAEYWLIAKKNYVMRYHELERIEDQIYFVSFPETIPRGLKYEEITLKHVEQLLNMEIECNIMLGEPYFQPFQIGITLRDVWRAIPIEKEARKFLTVALNEPQQSIYDYEKLYRQITANQELPNTNPIKDSNAGYAAQAEAEYQAEMEYYAYLDKLIEDRQYQLHAVEIALDMLNSKEFANSGMSPKDWLESERKRLAVKSLNDGTKSF